MDVWNRHRESEIHDIHEIGSGTKLLFAFLSLKVFRHEERERHNLSMLTAFTSSVLNQINASGAWRHSHPLVSIPIWDFYFDISEWHILSARAWTPALMLHLTNPCAKRQVLSLTKPKGKIYKMKSLGNYITIRPMARLIAIKVNNNRNNLLRNTKSIIKSLGTVTQNRKKNRDTPTQSAVKIS